MTEPANKPFFLSGNRGFLTAKPTDDYLHPEINSKVSGSTLTETQYFPISIPEANIHGFGYMWHHYNLKTISGGIFVWKGFKKYTVESEIFDYQNFMGDEAIANDLHDYRLDMGYGVKIIEPLNKFHLTYDDPRGDNSADLTYTAVMPPALFGDGNHFEQSLRINGTVVLDGQTYKVKDSYVTRDRSWGRLRQETPHPIPPIGWSTCTFNDDYAFNVTAFDHPDLDPVWKGKIEVPGGRVLNSGWVWKNGEILDIVSCRKKTSYRHDLIYPDITELEITDAKNNVHRVKGKAVAANNIYTWPNMRGIAALCRWETDGHVGTGEQQDMQYPAFVRLMSK